MKTEKHKINRRKKSKKPLLILVGLFIVFFIFIFLITRPSEQSKAITELNNCHNVDEVEAVWDRYKSNLKEDEEFRYAAIQKLSHLDLSEQQIKQCKLWLPPATRNVNIVVIPDLSRRIIDTINNPEQIRNDQLALTTIWNSFVQLCKFKKDSKDRLIVDVTDIDQAKGQFSNIANNLQFDLSLHKGKSNRLYFTDGKGEQFNKSILELYNSAVQKPLGADYRFYVRRYLPNRLQNSTLENDFTNKIIIITDGYLEAEDKPIDTKIKGYEKILYPAVANGNVLDVITNEQLNIPHANIQLPNTEVLICEVNERHIGKGYDYEILKTYWEDWFNRMGVKKVTIIPREQASDITQKHIEKFILN